MAGLRAWLLLAAMMLPMFSSSVVADPTYSIDHFLDAGSDKDFASPVTYSNDGSWLAVGHENGVTIWDTITDEQVGYVIIQDEPTDSVLSIEFEDDDRYLIAGQRSSIPSTPAVSIIDTETWTRVSSVEIGQDVDQLTVYPNAPAFFSIEDSGVLNLWNHSDGGPVKDWFLAPQSGETFVCHDISGDGETLMIGSHTTGEKGFLRTYNFSNKSILLEYETTSGLSDCTFAHNGSKIIWSADALIQIRSQPAGDYLGFIETSGHVIQLLPNERKGVLHVFTNREDASIESHDLTTLKKLSGRSLGHSFGQGDVSPDGNELAVSNGKEIVVVLRSEPRPSTAPISGPDFDRDGIPDEYDYDDDGDGHPDGFDNICVGANDCTKSPDPETIRRVQVIVESGSVIVTDTLTLNLTNSQMIRRLAAMTPSSRDFAVDVFEEERMEEALCGDYDVSEHTEAWRSSVRVNGTFIDVITSTCEVSAGLRGTTVTHNDRDHIRITWTTTASSSAIVIPPFDVHLLNFPGPVDGSIMESMPHQPIRYSTALADGPQASSDALRPDQVPLILSIEPLIEEDPTFSESMLSIILEYWWAALFVTGAILGLSMVLIRGRNKIDFDSMECEFCGALNNINAVMCDECDALFVYDQVMDKLLRWMRENDVTVEEMFNRFDTNQNGYLESDELLSGLISLRIAALPTEQLEALVLNLDVDGNGVIDLEELQIAITGVEDEWANWAEEHEVDNESWGEDREEEEGVSRAPRPPPDQRAPPRPPPDQRGVTTIPKRRVRQVVKEVPDETANDEVEIGSSESAGESDYSDIDQAISKMFADESSPNSGEKKGGRRRAVKRKRRNDD